MPKLTVAGVTVVHDGVTYGDGDDIVLSEADAERLVKLGVSSREKVVWKDDEGDRDGKDRDGDGKDGDGKDGDKSGNKGKGKG